MSNELRTRKNWLLVIFKITTSLIALYFIEELIRTIISSEGSLTVALVISCMLVGLLGASISAYQLGKGSYDSRLERDFFIFSFSGFCLGNFLLAALVIILKIKDPQFDSGVVAALLAMFLVPAANAIFGFFVGRKQQRIMFTTTFILVQ